MFIFYIVILLDLFFIFLLFFFIFPLDECIYDPIYFSTAITTIELR